MDKNLGNGDLFVRILRENTNDKILHWKLISDDIKKFIYEKFNIKSIEGYETKLTDRNEEIIIFIVKTNQEIPNKRYIIGFSDVNGEHIQFVPPEYFQDSKYISSVVALYQFIQSSINGNYDELKIKLERIGKLLNQETDM